MEKNKYTVGEKFPSWMKKYKKVMKYIPRNDGFLDTLVIVIKDNNKNRSLRYIKEGDTIEEMSEGILKVCNSGRFFPDCYCSIYKV